MLEKKWDRNTVFKREHDKKSEMYFVGVSVKETK